MEARLARPRLCSPGGPHTQPLEPHSGTWRWESVCFLIAPSFKASLLQPETNVGVAVPCIQSETKEKKTKRAPAPKPWKACGPFPSQNVQRERREHLCDYCIIESLEVQAPRVLRSRVLSPKGPRAPGMSPAGFACSAQVYTTCLSGPRASMNAPCPGKHPLPLTESGKYPL